MKTSRGQLRPQEFRTRQICLNRSCFIIWDTMLRVCPQLCLPLFGQGHGGHRITRLHLQTSESRRGTRNSPRGQGGGGGGGKSQSPPLPPVYWHFVALAGSELNQGTVTTASPTQSVQSEPLTSTSVCSGLGIFSPIVQSLPISAIGSRDAEQAS
jgi:hypothetical protein